MITTALQIKINALSHWLNTNEPEHKSYQHKSYQQKQNLLLHFKNKLNQRKRLSV